jgi:hypothetical protein
MPVRPLAAVLHCALHEGKTPAGVTVLGPRGCKYRNSKQQATVADKGGDVVLENEMDRGGLHGGQCVSCMFHRAVSWLQACCRVSCMLHRAAV